MHTKDKHFMWNARNQFKHDFINHVKTDNQSKEFYLYQAHIDDGES